MDAVGATNALTEVAVRMAERKELVHDYIRHHVLFHVADGNPSVWNLPFIRVPARIGEPLLHRRSPPGRSG